MLSSHLKRILIALTAAAGLCFTAACEPGTFDTQEQQEGTETITPEEEQPTDMQEEDSPIGGGPETESEMQQGMQQPQDGFEEGMQNIEEGLERMRQEADQMSDELGADAQEQLQGIEQRVEQFEQEIQQEIEDLRQTTDTAPAQDPALEEEVEEPGMFEEGEQQMQEQQDDMGF